MERMFEDNADNGKIKPNQVKKNAEGNMKHKLAIISTYWP